jgi:hypothetical protein
MTQRLENPCPYQDTIPDPLVIQPVASHYTDYATPAHTETQRGIILWSILNLKLQKISGMMQLQTVFLLNSDRPLSYELKNDLINVQQRTSD